MRASLARRLASIILGACLIGPAPPGLAGDPVTSDFRARLKTHDNKDCGVSCVLFVCEWFDIAADIDQVSRVLLVGPNGSSIREVHEATEKLGLHSSMFAARRNRCSMYPFP